MKKMTLDTLFAFIGPIAFIGLVGPASAAGTCEVKMRGSVIKTITAKDRQDCYNQTSFGSENCKRYASFLVAGNNLLEQYFNKTDRVNSDNCPGPVPAVQACDATSNGVLIVGAPSKYKSAAECLADPNYKADMICQNVTRNPGQFPQPKAYDWTIKYGKDIVGKGTCPAAAPAVQACDATSNGVLLVGAPSKYKSAAECLADPNYKADMLCLNVTRNPGQFPQPKAYVWTIKYGKDVIGTGTCAAGAGPAVAINNLPMQGGDEKTACPSLGNVIKRADASGYFSLMLPNLDKQCAFKGAGLKTSTIKFLTCAPDKRGKGFGPNATADLSCAQ